MYDDEGEILQPARLDADEGGGAYVMRARCGNCDYGSSIGRETSFPKGTPIADFPCPRCGNKTLRRA